MTDSELLKDGERIDDLQCNGFRIIQNPAHFCFGMDAVLLANFTSGKKSGRGMDLGTGTGIIPLLMLAKSKAASFTAIEIQEHMADMAARSAELNGVSDRLKVITGDICNIVKHRKTNLRSDDPDGSSSAESDINDKTIDVPRESCDIVTSNPPYIVDNGGLQNPKDSINIARHEILVKLEDIVEAASYLLKVGGCFSMVHKPFRMAEVFSIMKKYSLEPKRLQMVQPREGSEPSVFLVEAIKGGRSGLKILPALNVYNTDGSYTRELLAYYN